MADAELDLLARLAGKGGNDTAKAGVRARFEASVLATYNTYFPFYEEVVLRRLAASGCHHNILFVDAARLAESLADPAMRPRLAGRAYTLVPMRAPGAFHPKVALLVGKRHARLFVGSHNVTLSGFGKNREISTELDLPLGKDDPSAGVARSAWTFLEGWLRKQTHVPEAVSHAAQLVASRFAPWLRDPGQQGPGPLFYGATPDGEALWTALREHFLPRARQLVLLGPFFDSKFAFLAKLQEELRPREFVVGIEPDRVQMSGQTSPPKGIRFVDAGDIAPDHAGGYLHAKAIFAELETSEAVLAVGSANPSAPAWLAEPETRNAEAVIVHRGSVARQIAQALGLVDLLRKPGLSTAQWSAIRERCKQVDPGDRPGDRETCALAVIEDGAVNVSLAASVARTVTRVIGYRVVGPVPLFDCKEFALTESGLRFEVPPEALSSLGVVELHAAGGLLRAIVHHPAAIASLSRTSSQQQFREALDALAGESSDLPTVIRLAEKMIFDGERADPPDVRSTGPGHRGGGTDDDKPLDSLIVESRAEKKSKQRVHELRAGDLGFIIDTLIHRLGVGIQTAAEALERHGPSEEEQIGADDETVPPPVEGQTSAADIVDVCHSKVRSLTNRMCRQLVNALERKSPPGSAVQQLLAVLAVLREVRRQDIKLAAVIHGGTLVPVERRCELLHRALATLFERKRGLYVAALDAFGDDPEGDLSRLRGLLMWLAWDAGLDARRAPTLSENHAEWQERLEEKAKLLSLVQVVVPDDDAREEARHSLWSTASEIHQAEAMRWLDAHFRWGEAIIECYRARASWPKDIGKAEPGMMALAVREQVKRLRLLCGIDKRKAMLLDLGEPEGHVSFVLNAVTFSELPVLGDH
jgi:hypothetical protein